MSTIKKRLRIETRNITDDTTLSAIDLTGWAKSLDFYNYGETLAIVHFSADATGSPGIRLEAGQNLSIEANEGQGTDLSEISIEFTEANLVKSINLTVAKHEII